MIAVAGSGDGPFIDKLIEKVWEEVCIASSFDKACALAEKAIKDTHREYGKIFQQGFVPHVEMMYGIKMHGSCKLFLSDGPVVNEKESYGSVGAGYYMADFLAGRMHRKNFPSSQVITLAAYILFQCKEHVDGCGGDSHIALLNEKGGSDLVSSMEINASTQTLKNVDEVLSYLLLLPSADIHFPETEFYEVLETATNAITGYRKSAKESLDYWLNIKKQLIKPSAFSKIGQTDKEPLGG
jgi:hypothetical protein